MADRPKLTPDEVEAVIVAIDKAHQLGGNYPSPSALDRARRVLRGEITHEEAVAEIEAKYRQT